MKFHHLLVVLLLVPGAGFAAIDITQGAGAQCLDVVSELKRNWFHVKQYMTPGQSDIRSPKDDDFVCISNAAVNNAMEKRTVTNSTLRCFSLPIHRGLGFCCDSQLNACAQLNPYLFPETFEQQTHEKPYEPPASLWVKPPTNGDQWKTN